MITNLRFHVLGMSLVTFTTILSTNAPVNAISLSPFTVRADWETAVAGESLSFSEEDFNSYTR